MEKHICELKPAGSSGWMGKDGKPATKEIMESMTWACGCGRTGHVGELTECMNGGDCPDDKFHCPGCGGIYSWVWD